MLFEWNDRTFFGVSANIYSLHVDITSKQLKNNFLVEELIREISTFFSFTNLRGSGKKTSNECYSRSGKHEKQNNSSIALDFNILRYLSPSTTLFVFTIKIARLT